MAIRDIEVWTIWLAEQLTGFTISTFASATAILAIAAVVIALVARSLLRHILKTFYGIAITTSIRHDWHDWSTLKRLLVLTTVFELVLSLPLYFYVLRAKLNWLAYFNSLKALLLIDSWVVFFNEKWPVVLLGTATLYIFYACRRDVRWQAKMLPSLFSRANTPVIWSDLEGAKAVIPLAIMFNCLFLMLAFFLDNLVAYSATITIFYFISTINHFLLVANARKYLNDPRYSPLPSDNARTEILHRRAIIGAFFQHKRLIWKEALVTLACSTVFALTALKYLRMPVDVASWALYLLMTTVILLNEFTIYAWRRRRELQLAPAKGEP